MTLRSAHSDGRDVPRWDVPPNSATSESSAEAIGGLQNHFNINKVIARMLYQAGYSAPRTLAAVSPKEVALSLSALRNMDAIRACELLPTIRRIVLLGNIENATESAALAERYGNMSEVNLVMKGIWQEGFDDLAGVKILRKVEDGWAAV